MKFYSYLLIHLIHLANPIAMENVRSSVSVEIHIEIVSWEWIVKNNTVGCWWKFSDC